MAQTRPPLIALIGIALVVAAVAGVAFMQRSHSRVRVRSAEQAVAMAKAAYAHPEEALPVQVATEQDGWTIKLGPDREGRTHVYGVSIWDKRAAEQLADVTDVAVVVPK